MHDKRGSDGGVEVRRRMRRASTHGEDGRPVRLQEVEVSTDQSRTLSREDLRQMSRVQNGKTKGGFIDFDIRGQIDNEVVANE